MLCEIRSRLQSFGWFKVNKISNLLLMSVR